MNAAGYRQRLQDALAALRERRRRLDSAIEAIEQELGTQPQEAGPPVQGGATGGAEVAGRFANMSAPKAAEIVLREHGEPMHIRKIADAVLRGGYRSTSKKVRNSLYTNLMRKDDDFYRLEDVPATFGLREWLGDEEEEGEKQTREASEEEPPTPLVQE